MFGFKDRRELKRRVDELELEKRCLERELRWANNDKEVLQHSLDKIKGTVQDCTMVVDFDRMDAFSVERMIKDGKECTVIGYRNEGKIREWLLWCSRDQHERIVTEFNEWKK
jgi:hypothetical protein